MRLCRAPKPEEVNFVIYHGYCTDGFGAAFSAWKRLGRENVFYWGTQHGIAPPDVTGKHVAIVDFSYKRPVLEKMMKSAASLIILDHHKSAQEDLEGLEANTVFDMHRSGATITWSWFHPNTPVPLFLQYIQDKDIWTWLLPQSKEFSIAFDMVEQSFESFDRFLDEKLVASTIEKGTALLEYTNIKVNKLAKDAELRVLRATGDLLYVLNTSLFVSEIGHVLASRPEVQFAMTYFYDFERKINVCSLRGSHENQFDVSAVAARFGGGGHKKAAGFTYAGNIEDLFATPPGKE